MNRVAAGLSQRFDIGDRALLLVAPGLSFPVAYFGCMAAGIIPAPLYPPHRNQKLDRLEAVRADAQARFALVDPGTRQDLERRHAESGETLPVPVVGLDELEGSPGWAPPTRGRDDIAFLQYTSGSTGTPKGVMVSHGNLLTNSAQIDRNWVHSADSMMVSWLPLFHDLGLIYGLLQPLYTGFPAVLMAPFSFLKNPFRWLEAITRYRGTHSAAPNFAYDLCVDRATPERCQGLDLSSWRMAMNGAEPINPRTLERFAEVFEPFGFDPSIMTPAYGLAEATLMVRSQTWDRPPRVVAFDGAELERNRAVPVTPEPEAAPGSVREVVGCGVGPEDVEVIVVDPDTRERLDDGRVGEVWIHGGLVAQGYWDRPETTEETFHATVEGDDSGHHYLRTGDLGFLLDGELFIAGRLKELVIIRGRNFYPQDIERTVAGCHDDLRSGAGAVFSVEGDGGEELVVVQEVMRRAVKNLDADDVFARIRQAVAEEFDLQVAAIELVRQGSVGKTSSGKLQRRGTKLKFLADELETVVRWRRPAPPTPSAQPAPATPGIERRQRDGVVRRLAEIVAPALGVGPDDLPGDVPIARYGLSSQVAVSLAARLEEVFERSIPTTLLYDYPTLDAVAGYLLDAGRPGAGGISWADLRRGEPVAVVGIGCRFPGAAGKAAFWELLRDGVDAIRPMPPERAALLPERSVEHPGGWLDGVDGFDASYFGISPREAERMDPQQRLLLEVAVEALEDAAVDPAALAGTATGVFVGVSGHDYERLLVESGGAAHPYTGTGTASSLAANRLSYLFDLRGPSVSVDTACSSSLVALHLARRSLDAADCDVALAGGVNLVLDTQVTEGFREAGMLAPDGRCKTFSAAADGYGRGEGCGLLVLKRLADAQRDGDPILGLVHGSAINQDGRSNGLTAPNSLAQEDVQRRALADAATEPAQVGYVEAHGTGTALGDPIEVSALRRVYGEGGEAVDRPEGSACALGSVKTNIGHLESAAGVAGVIKTLLALDARTIPPHLHLEALNPDLDLGPLTIPTEATPWPLLGQNGDDEPDEPARAAVSSFGFGGANAHVILGAAPQSQAPVIEKKGHALLPLSAQSPEALAELAGRWADALESQPVPSRWQRAVATAAVGRAHHEHRLTVLTDDPGDSEAARQALEAFAADRDAADHPALASGRATPRRPRIGFLFTGQGAQTPGMGRELYDAYPVFRDALDRCAAVLAEHLDVPLLELLFGDGHSDTDPERLHQTGHAQPALFAVEYALAELLAGWGIEPDAMLGHSVGEYVAACRAGMLELDDALALVATRARLMQALPAGGAMVTLFAPEDRAAPLIDAAGAEVAAVNAPGKVVASGPEKVVTALEAAAAEHGIETRRLRVSHAFHSALMEPALDELEAAAARVTAHDPRVPVISNRTGKPHDGAPDAAYWREHLRRPVRFADGLKALAERCDVLLEIGPRPVLSALARETVDTPVVPTLRSGGDDPRRLLAAVGELYRTGVDIHWHALTAAQGAPPPRLSGLPTYPFRRDRHWYEPIARRTAGTPRLVPYEELTADPNLAEGLSALARRHAVGAASVSQVTGKSLLFVGSRGDAFCFLARQGDTVFALDYTGPEASWEPFLDELTTTVEAAGLEPAYLDETGRRVPSLQQRGWLATTIGVWQDVEELQGFTLEGRKKRRLRYLVNKYENEAASPAESDRASVTELPADGPDEATAAELRQILDEWAAAKNMSPRFADHIARAVTDGLPLGRHRVFVIRRDGRIDGAVLILPAPALDGYLMDMEFYRSDAALGWVEFGIAGILQTLIAEGAQTFSLGLTPGTGIEERPGDDPEVRELFTTLHDEEILNGDANAQFKNKFRPVTRSAYLCSPPGAGSRRGMEFLAALNEPFTPVAELAAALTAAGRDDAPTAAPAGPVATGLLHRRLDLAEGGPVFETDCSTARLPVMADHRVGDRAVLPATAYAELAWDVAQRLGRPPVIERLTLDEVLPIPEQPPRKLQVTVRDDGTLTFASRAGETTWVRHGEAVLGIADAERTPGNNPENHDPETVRQRCSEERDGAEIYRRLADMGLAYGPAFRGLDTVWLGDGEALARVTPPAGLDGGGYRFHPALLDACLHAYVPLAGLGEGGDDGLWLPVALEGLRLYGPASSAAACGDLYAHLEELDAPDGERAFRLHVSDAGGLRVRCDTVRLRPARLAALQERRRRELAEILWRPTWRPAERPATTPAPAGTRYLLLPDDGLEGAAALAAALEARGGRVEPVSPAGLGEALATTGDDDLDTRVVLHARAGVPKLDDIDLENLGDALLDGSLGTLLDAVHTLVADGAPAAKLWLVTEDPASADGGPLGGLARVIEREHPEVWGGWLELSGVDTAEVADAVAEALTGGGGSRRRWAEGGWQEEALEPAPVPVGSEGPPSELDPDGLVIITGGLGGLGLAVAGRLADLGARRLLLLGRSEPGPTALQAIDALRERGVDVGTARADVTDFASLRAALGEDRDSVQGVVHAAGVLDDALLARQDRERFRRALAPKVDGAWNLHRLTRDLDLRFFVLFSSVSSTLGTPGQANYAAGNAFLDALAAQRRAAGLPAVSLQWGPWAEIGMAARTGGDDAGAPYRALGLVPLRTASALTALEATLTSDTPRWVVLGVDPANFPTGPLADLPVLAPVLEAVRDRRTKSAAPDQTGTASAAPALDRQALLDLPEADRRGRLTEALTVEVARAVGVAPGSVDPDRSTDQLGIDSLVVMELRNRLKGDLGVEVPASFFFEFPSVHEIADRVLELAAASGTPATEPAAELAAPAISAGDVDDLSGDDVDALLAQLLAEGDG